MISSILLKRSSSSFSTLLTRSLHQSIQPSSSSSQSSTTKIDSIEDYLHQRSTNPITSSVPPTHSIISNTNQPSHEITPIPASPSWAMRAHPELINPPVLKPTHRIHVATLVIEAYNPEKVQLPIVAGFALQAAYHLGIPVSRPMAMPIKTELHTVLRSGFVHKKSQENFWRLTHRRVIKAYDANEEVINRWINYLKTDAVRGTNVALKAQRFQYRPLGWAQTVDELTQREIELDRLENPSTRTKKKGKKKTNAQNSSSLQQSLAQDDVSPAETIKALAEKLIKEELQPKAEAHEALLNATNTRDGKKMAELEVKKDLKN